MSIETVIKAVYRRWQRARTPDAAHPDEETLALFADNRLDAQAAAGVKRHAVACPQCSGIIALSITQPLAEGQEVPVVPAPVEIVLRLRDKIIEVISAAGDIIVGQELVPASMLRGRNMSEFKDEVAILKDFAKARVGIKVRALQNMQFSVSVSVKDAAAGVPRADVRIVLIKGTKELESYAARAGEALFDRITPGRYEIEIRDMEKLLAHMIVDVAA